MTKMLLPLRVPPVTSYLHHGYPMSIMMEDPRSLAWIYSHYIQLCFPMNEQLYATDFNFYHYNYPFSGHYICPFIYHKQFSMKLIQRYSDFRAYMIDSIDDLNYVHVYCDEYYVPHRAAYRQRHQIHGNLVYGYDLETREYAISGYDENGTFRNTRVSFAELEEAVKPTEHFDVFWYDMVMHYSKWDSHYEFDVEPVIELLRDYVQGRDTSLRYGIRMFTTDKRFGKDIYPLFASYIEAVKAGAMALDIRPFHLLWEHKQLMLDRMRFMIDNGFLRKDSELPEAYAPIERACFAIRGDALKANASGSTSFLASTAGALQEVAAEEVKVLSRMIEELEAMASGAGAGSRGGEWEDAVDFQF